MKTIGEVVMEYAQNNPRQDTSVGLDLLGLGYTIILRRQKMRKILFLLLPLVITTCAVAPSVKTKESPPVLAVAAPESEVGVAEKPIAYCDKVIVCQGRHCGAGNTGGCNPNLWFWGHSSDGGDVAFRVLLRDKDGNVLGDSFRSDVQGGYYRWVGGLISQRCDGVLTTSSRNKGAPWNACDFLIPTRGAGGYTLSQYVDYQTQPSSLPVYPEITYTIQALASPVGTETTPDGKFLHRWSLGEWNWDAMCEVPLHIYYKDRKYLCDEASSGEIPYYRAPKVSGITYQITNDENHQGYANATFTFGTDIGAQGRVYYQVAVDGECDPTSGWRSGVSAPGTEHTVSLAPETLWYDVEVRKVYCYQIIAWPPEYRFVDVARGVSGVYTFTIPHIQ